MEPISHYAMRIGNQYDTLWKDRKSLLVFCLGVVLYLLLTSLKVKSTSGNREQGACKARYCPCLPVVARHMVLTVSVERCPETTSLTSLLCLLPGQTLICSNLLANALPPSWGLSRQCSSPMTHMICLIQQRAQHSRGAK